MAEATIPLTLPVEQFTQTRYRCPYCRRSWTSLKRANEHRDKCWHRPGGCKTCRHADMENGWVVDCGIGEDLREPLGENLDGVAEFGQVHWETELYRWSARSGWMPARSLHCGCCTHPHDLPNGGHDFTAGQWKARQPRPKEPSDA